jgi:hypothetical protein
MSEVFDGPEISSALVGRPRPQSWRTMTLCSVGSMAAASSRTKWIGGTSDSRRGSCSSGHSTRLPVSAIAQRAAVKPASTFSKSSVFHSAAGRS